MSNKKNYIGKGKEGNFGTLRVRINLGDADQFKEAGKDQMYLNFFISKLQQPDNFGNTHTAYVLTNSEETETDPVADKQEAELVAEPIVEPVTKVKPKRKNSTK